MKYSIVLHPEKTREWGLNLTEAVIFSFCYELPSWADAVIVNGITMFRGNRRKASEEMGLDLAPDTIYRTYKKLHDKGLIVYVKNGNNDLIALTDTGRTWGGNGKKSEDSEKNPSKLGKKSESHYIVYNDTNNNTPQPPAGELQSLSPAPATTQTPRRPPVTWEAVLRLRATPALDGTVSPAEDGDIWERRMFLFDAVRRKYPGTKAGLLQEFNGFLKKCWKDKLELDTELSRMLYAILYQIKWKEAKNQAEEFSAAWKNFSTWVNQAYWQSDMDSWKNKSEWFHTLCSAETKQEVERLKSILVCK